MFSNHLKQIKAVYKVWVWRCFYGRCSADDPCSIVSYGSFLKELELKNTRQYKEIIGGGFKYVLFSPRYLGKIIPNFSDYFFRWVENVCHDQWPDGWDLMQIYPFSHNHGSVKNYPKWKETHMIKEFREKGPIFHSYYLKLIMKRDPFSTEPWFYEEEYGFSWFADEKLDPFFGLEIFASLMTDSHGTISYIYLLIYLYIGLSPFQ